MGLYKTKQLIIVRKDLDMPSGKMAAQVAHASIALFTQHSVNEENEIRIKLNQVTKEWLDNDFAKEVLQVPNLETLESCYELAKQLGFSVSKIIDNGATCFNGKKTLTCISIGPEYSSKLDEVFGKLKLYK